MPLRYAVETCPNNATVLHMKLNEAADNGGRVLNVIWQPEHDAIDHQTDYDPRTRVEAGYVIILEYFEAEP
ncbi:MAG: hypothetical protein E5X80_08285 [Mesorhizobium sp.]|uniref:hypothetical protein n=1 Tax=Mesorhizobium sp. TaxID=1871066 RepID=UPI000FE5C5D9|nr:hypothetical protein [Mesorhizobium sp.]RWM06976.1 MAG: hypothetical protein EOR71_18020 [Mesorhizobium sp.]TIO53877.1 MAG: hypothetical protein E5X78_05825 [Mesorhizobium sp.]TIO61504.1 MAG: hypothetical protein E5X79_06970 [Mesorhizobium sp.]TJV65890.1 MAG: hypothetical protein E5X80_08285 [Mesorhizobium sp.]